jgi:hypothetical protein
MGPIEGNDGIAGFMCPTRPNPLLTFLPAFPYSFMATTLDPNRLPLKYQYSMANVIHAKTTPINMTIKTPPNQQISLNKIQNKDYIEIEIKLLPILLILMPSLCFLVS